MQVHLRDANRDDAEDIAALIDLAGEGLPSVLWARRAEHGQNPLEVGRARTMRDAGFLTWKQTTIAEFHGEVAGALITRMIGKCPSETTSDTHPMTRPQIKLENKALNTCNLNVLAIFPEARRHGIGTQLIGLAERRAGPEGMSVLVGDKNAGARAFLREMGYVEAERTNVIRGDWETDNSKWLLLTKH